MAVTLSVAVAALVAPPLSDVAGADEVSRAECRAAVRSTAGDPRGVLVTSVRVCAAIDPASQLGAQINQAITTTTPAVVDKVQRLVRWCAANGVTAALTGQIDNCVGPIVDFLLKKVGWAPFIDNWINDHVLPHGCPKDDLEKCLSLVDNIVVASAGGPIPGTIGTPAAIDPFDLVENAQNYAWGFSDRVLFNPGDFTGPNSPTTWDFTTLEFVEFAPSATLNELEVLAALNGDPTAEFLGGDTFVPGGAEETLALDGVFPRSDELTYTFATDPNLVIQPLSQAELSAMLDANAAIGNYQLNTATFTPVPFDLAL